MHCIAALQDCTAVLCGCTALCTGTKQAVPELQPVDIGSAPLSGAEIPRVDMWLNL